MRFRVAIPLLSVVLGLLFSYGYRQPAAAALAVPACTGGCMDMSYYVGRPLVQSPTGEKPQSKLWYNDGFWWGSLFNNVAGTYRIYRLNWNTQIWEDTNVVLDIRPETKADVLWDGSHLYVASGGGFDPSGQGTRKALDAVLFRFHYDPTTKMYVKDFGPITIRKGGAETIVIDKDTAGRLWITYTQGGKLYVNYSRATESDWDATTPLALAPTGTNGNVSPDDISSLVAVDGKIGVLWSNQNDDTFYFASHVDGTAPTSWTGRALYRQTDAADDHINIKGIQTDAGGNIYAMVKTSYNTLGSPQLLLLVGKKSGTGYTWNVYIESYRQEGQTRPLLLIDNENRKLYVFTSDEGGGDINYKVSNLDNIQFGFAKTDLILFMHANGYALNNVTSTKQSVHGGSDIVVMASHDNEAKLDSAGTDNYFHSYVSLPGTGPTSTPTAPTTPTRSATPTATPTTTPGPATHNQIFVPLVKK
jgi:hypothetical protein